VDKAPGMVVHPGHGCRTGTLVHALLGRGFALAAAGGADRPGIVHRLDRGTSGLIVVARTDRALRALAAAFAGRLVRKTYQAIVWGRPDPPSGRIDRPIGRSRRDPTRMAVGGRGGREAATTYRTVEAFPGFARLEIGLLTGRTHQIRVHLQAIHHPIVGDERYAGRPWRGVQDPRRRNALREFPRPALHASDLAFEHPATGETVAFHAPIPADMQDLLAVLRATS